MIPRHPFETPFEARAQDDPSVRLRFMLAAPVEAEVLTLIAKSVTTVWTRLRGTDVDLEIVVTHAVRFSGGGEDPMPTSYRPGRNRLVVGLDQVRGWASHLGISFEGALVIAVSHEATHAVQDAEGRLPQTIEETHAYENAYLGHPCEVEAWDTSLDVVKAFRPEANGVFDAGHGVQHAVPDVSRFTRTWSEAEFAYELTDRLPSQFRRVERLEELLDEAERAEEKRSVRETPASPRARGLLGRVR